jgi:putative ABC transport system substrate-binding protein
MSLARRDFITLLGGAAAAWPLAARAQQRALPVVGYLHSGSAEAYAPLVAAFRKGLGEAGYIEGRSVAVEYRFANDQADRLAELIGDLVRRKVSVIAVAGSSDAALAAKAATATIPIVFLNGADPVRLGLVASLNRPTGNVTGITSLSAELSGKRLGLLQAAAPGTTRFGVLVNADSAIRDAMISDVKAAASAIGLQIELFLTTDRTLETAFASMAEKRISALVVSSDAMFISRRIELALLAVKHSMIAIYPFRENAEGGGLMSYGPDATETNRQLGVYVGRILKGEKPADLPVMQGSKFELVINLQTARVMGLEIPGTISALADKVIE